MSLFYFEKILFYGGVENEKVIHSKPIISCVLVFLVCCIARIIKYFLIRTDETILAENFIHIVTNLLHVISNNETDSMQIVRILIGQLISFLLVVIYYKKNERVSEDVYELE